ncbi:MAG: tetratricopeptide repeat protein, partial [bacterium]|nr:tetratricopeptide repeat protein [bacterium]
KSLKIREKIGDRRGQATSLNNIGAVHGRLGDYPQTLEYYAKSLKIYEEIGAREGQATSLNNIGVVQDTIGDYPKALEYYTKSWKIQEETGDRKGQATSLNNIGYVHDSLGDYPQALEYYAKSLKIREEIGDREGQTLSLNNIGRIHLDRGEYDEARLHFTQCEKIAREIGSKEILRRASISLGELEIGQDSEGCSRQRAREYAGQALHLAQDLNSKSGKAEALLLQGRIEKDEDKFKEVLAIFKELKQPLETAKACYYYGQALGRLEKTEEAREIFEKLGAKGWLAKIDANDG